MKSLHDQQLLEFLGLSPRMSPHAFLSCFLLGLAGLTAWFQHGPTEEPLGKSTPAFRAFRDNYVLIFSTAMAGDWLQGPYIYYLYEHYGFAVGPIGQLFIAGFASSMLFGTLAGVLADKYGRRRACIAYCISYTISCITKHSGSFQVLLLGRVLGGISTSLLFSSFEAWVASEHARRGFDEELLAGVFSRASTVGAGLMAIMAGLVGDVLVERFALGPVAPFDAAAVVLVITGCIVFATWTENYGGQTHEGVGKRLRAAVITIYSDRRIALLGALQAMFEATLYTFVFLWTPALGSGGEKVPHGMVFSCFMAACMAGSAFAGRLLSRYRPQHFMIWVYVASLLAMGVPFLVNCPSLGAWLRLQDPSAAGQAFVAFGGRDLGLGSYLQIAAFCVFEFCLGIFWPAMMTLRAQVVPEDMRSTIINCFRLPLNLFVCVALCKVEDYSLATMFALCMSLLGGCVACQWLLNKELMHTTRHSTSKQHIVYIQSSHVQSGDQSATGAQVFNPRQC